MPPLVHIETVATPLDYADGVLTLAAPTRCKKGDRIVAFIAAADWGGVSFASPDTDEAWEDVLDSEHQVGVVDIRLAVITRIFDPADPAAMSVMLSGEPEDLAWCAIAYRAAVEDLAEGVINDGNEAAFEAETDVVFPSIDFPEYSGLFIGVAISGDNQAATCPAGTNERFDGSGDTDGVVRLLVMDWLPEAAGASGTKTATLAGASDGFCLSFGLRAGGLLGGKSLSGVGPQVGMLGLPRRGV
jgi:hypothetical protein